MKRLSRILFALGTLVSIIAGLVVASGRVDGLSHNGSASADVAFLSIVLYWALGSCVCWCVANCRERWRQILLAGISVLLCLTALEVGLRILRPSLALREFEFVRSAVQHHVLLPNTSYDLGMFEGRNVVVSTNADRLRTSYSVEAFQAKSQRIVCLGDSFTFGAWVNAEDSYPEQLEGILGKQGMPDVGVLNAGMLSYSPLLHEQLLKKTLAKYSPTIVTLMLDCTDIGDDFHYALNIDRSSESLRFNGAGMAYSKPHFGALWRLSKPVQPAVLAPFRLLRRLDKRFRPHDPLDYYKFEIPVNDVTERDRFFIYRYPLEVTQSYFASCYERILSIAEFCQNNDMKFVLFVAPRYHHWSLKESPNNWEAKTYGDFKEHQYVIFEFFDGKMDEASFPIVNMLQPFQDTDEFPLVFDTDPHWNERGNAFVARIIARELQKIAETPTPALNADGKR